MSTSILIIVREIGHVSAVPADVVPVLAARVEIAQDANPLNARNVTLYPTTVAMAAIVPDANQAATRAIAKHALTVPALSVKVLLTWPAVMDSAMILRLKNAAPMFLPIISAISTTAAVKAIAVSTAAVNLNSRIYYGA